MLAISPSGYSTESRSPIGGPDFGFIYPEPGMVAGGRYQLLRHLGSGAYSTTWLVLDLLSGNQRRYYALKLLTRYATEEHRIGRMNELAFLRRLHAHPRRSSMNLPVIQNEVEMCSPKGPHLCFVLPLEAQDVNSLRESSPTKTLKPYIVKAIINAVLEAVIALHETGIIHTDIKASNVLISGVDSEMVEEYLEEFPPELVGETYGEGFVYKLFAPRPVESHSCTWDMDHLLSELQGYTLIDLSHGQWAGRQPTVGIFGSPELRAPEAIIGSDFTPRIDIWAIGCMTYELLCGEWLFNPVDGGSEWSQNEDMLAQIYALTGERFRKVVLDRAIFKDLVHVDDEGKLLRKEELPPVTLEERITRCGLLPPEEIPLTVDFLKKCLRLESANRAPATELIEHPWVLGWMTGQGPASLSE